MPGYGRGSLSLFSAVQPVEKVAFNEVREKVLVNDIPIHLFEALGLRDILVQLSARFHNQEPLVVSQIPEHYWLSDGLKETLR